jgi:hypothetical protein
MSWDDTKEYASMLGLMTVKELYRGIFDESLIKQLYQETVDGDICEGYVLRVVDSFEYSKFNKCVAKYVRANHVSTQAHWTRKIQPNAIKIDG